LVYFATGIMKKLTVNQIIDIKLQEWGRVDLRGIGTIKLLHDNAVIDWTESVIKPPAALIVFSETDHIDPQFSIHNNALLLEHELDYDRYLEHFFQEINECDCLVIENLGRFVKSEGGKIRFNYDPHSSHIQAFSLKAVYSISIPSQTVSANPAHVQSDTIARRFDKRLLVRLGFSVAFLLFAMIVYNQYNLLKFNKTFVSIPEDRVNVKPESLVLSDIYFPDTSELLDSDIAAEPEMEEIEDVITTGPTDLDDIQKLSKTDCLIVVGAFSLDANANRMLELLSKQGYEAGTDAGGGLTRVGIKVACEDYSDLLNRIRSEIEPNAWILGN
jgi:hypothetical protein